MAMLRIPSSLEVRVKKHTYIPATRQFRTQNLTDRSLESFGTCTTFVCQRVVGSTDRSVAFTAVRAAVVRPQCRSHLPTRPGGDGESRGFRPARLNYHRAPSASFLMKRVIDIFSFFCVCNRISGWLSCFLKIETDIVPYLLCGLSQHSWTT